MLILLSIKSSEAYDFLLASYLMVLSMRMPLLISAIVKLAVDVVVAAVVATVEVTGLFYKKKFIYHLTKGQKGVGGEREKCK